MSDKDLSYEAFLASVRRAWMEMSNKNKTVSFRINEKKFNKLREVADKNDISLSKVFRDYVDKIISHDGQVKATASHNLRDQTTGVSDEFPLTVQVPKSFVREQERVELECEHLREQLEEYKQYASQLQRQVEEQQAIEDNLIHLEDVDFETGNSIAVEED